MGGVFHAMSNTLVCRGPCGAAELALLEKLANMSRLRWEQCVSALPHVSAASVELRELVEDMSTCVVDVDNHIWPNNTAKNIALTRIAAQACHASIEGGKDCQGAVHASGDILALCCVCVCGIGCRLR